MAPAWKAALCRLTLCRGKPRLARSDVPGKGGRPRLRRRAAVSRLGDGGLMTESQRAQQAAHMIGARLATLLRAGAESEL
jgi:hypothetical protein